MKENKENSGGGSFVEPAALPAAAPLGGAGSRVQPQARRRLRLALAALASVGARLSSATARAFVRRLAQIYKMSPNLLIFFLVVVAANIARLGENIGQYSF